MEFNINDYVRVRMTDDGRKVCERAKLRVYEQDGWSIWQLWELMAIFGSHIYMGGPTLFETTIDIPEKVT